MRSKWSSLLVAIMLVVGSAGLAGAQPIAFGPLDLPEEDYKTYPGHNCQPHTSDQSVRRYGGIENLDTTERFFYCPIVRDVESDDVELVEVWVEDWSPTGKVRCCFHDARLDTSTLATSACAETETTFKGQTALSFGAGDANVGKTNPFYYYFVRCSLPAFDPNQVGYSKRGSAIFSYRVYENDGDD